MGLWFLRRVGYGFLILFGVNVLTFFLFFQVNTPDDIARIQLGTKRVTAEAITRWKAQRGYDKPLFYNEKQEGLEQLTQTIFFQKSVRLFALDFGVADDGRSITAQISERAIPSLMISIPVFVIGLLVNICLSLLLVAVRGSRLDTGAQALLVSMMSISFLFYIIAGQYIFSKLWHWVPISGYAPGLAGLAFLILPVIIGVIGGIGSTTRLYRTVFLEEIGRDYVRTARAKGLSESLILFRHILRNGLIPILTSVVVVIPSLFMGSLILESFFGIPGLGSYTIEAIQAQDFAIVRAMVFIGTVLYVAGLILTDLSYTWADPRVRLSE